MYFDNWPPEILCYLGEFLVGMDEYAPRGLAKFSRLCKWVRLALVDYIEKLKPLPFIRLLADGPLELIELKTKYVEMGFKRTWLRRGLRDWMKSCNKLFLVKEIKGLPYVSNIGECVLKFLFWCLLADGRETLC